MTDPLQQLPPSDPFATKCGCNRYPCDHTGCDCGDGPFHNPGPDCPGQKEWTDAG